jgi:hypothetical protein
MATQQETNDGQQKINGELCRVDWRLIVALKEVRAILATTPGVDIAALTLAIDEAAAISALVADIKPPGCMPESQKS